MVSTVSIIPSEFLGDYEENLSGDYDVEFGDEDAAHLRPLHIKATIRGISVDKVLIDGGATISLLLERMLVKARKHFDYLVPTIILITDYHGISTPAKGLVTLQVQVDSSIRTIVFIVVSSRASYNALLGQDWIHDVGIHIHFKVYNDKLKPLDVDRNLNYYNCEGCFLTSKGLNIKLRTRSWNILLQFGTLRKGPYNRASSARTLASSFLSSSLDRAHCSRALATDKP
ncbi:hypothetical protein Ahy_B09g099096 [Arachis hypogaea]|uniref:Peptidase A2 domain-containing protein n=1 Tax=Arachis hypogaea TaxID=3818 RepID=A0A444XSV0_ARAHY|nr:hypothetical protein Ahy_B09g099096 [Arachis hypogaea]